ncbi:hypothetical protein HMI54_008861 [Coelomomyces lativittatus]|nr:hypothetical protein HMI54_008861 [Coelomomyces lativittatus]KAJ1506318.1 hypothetical protein HMI55_001227 [Coelomomyces lativittatus]
MLYPLVIIINLLLGLSIAIFIFYLPIRIRTRANYPIPYVHYTHFALLCTIAVGALVLQNSTTKSNITLKSKHASVSAGFCYVHLAFTNVFFTLSIALASTFWIPWRGTVLYGLGSLLSLAIAGTPEPRGRFMCGFSRWGLLLLFASVYILPGLFLCRNRYGILLMCLWVWWIIRLSVLTTDLVTALLLSVSAPFVLIKPATQL